MIIKYKQKKYEIKIPISVFTVLGIIFLGIMFQGSTGITDGIITNQNDFFIFLFVAILTTWGLACIIAIEITFDKIKTKELK